MRFRRQSNQQTLLPASPRRQKRSRRVDRRLRLESLESRRLLASDVIIGANDDLGSYIRDFDALSNTATYRPNLAGTSTAFVELGASTLAADLEAGVNVIVETQEAGTTDPGTIIVSDAISKTLGGDASLQLLAETGIVVAGLIESTSGQLDVLFNTDTDANGGALELTIDGTITTNGGNVTVSGGADPMTGFARGTSNVTTGAVLSGSLITAGGNVTLRGTGSLLGGEGVSLGSGAAIDVGSGTLDIVGVAVAGSLGLGVGVLVDGSSLSANDGTINIDGTGAGSGSSHDGVQISNGAHLANSSTGTISIIGRTSGGTDNNRGVAITGTNTAVTAVDGAISVNGAAGGGGEFNHGTRIGDQAQVQVSGSGDVSIVGVNSGGSRENSGVEIAASSVLAAGGALIVDGTSGGIQDANHGVFIHADAVVSNTGNGAINVTGIGSVAGTSSNTGVSVAGAATRLATVDGNLSLGGTGSSSGDFNHGIAVRNGSQVLSAGNGMIFLTGINSSGTDTNIGVLIDSTGTTIRSSGGGTTISGSSNATGNNNDGVQIAAGGTVEDTGQAAISVIGTGGDGVDGNRGILLTDTGTVIRSSGGGISLVGTGRGSGDFNDGILVFQNAVVEDASTGDVSLQGVSASGGTGNGGIFLGSQTEIRSLGGSLTLDGTANGTAETSFGVGMFEAAVSTTGTGTIQMVGIGGPGTNTNAGVWLNQGSAITSVDGSITVEGTGRGTAASNYGIEIFGDSRVDSSGGGQISLQGTSPDATIEAVRLLDSLSSVSTAGSLEITAVTGAANFTDLNLVGAPTTVIGRLTPGGSTAEQTQFDGGLILTSSSTLQAEIDGRTPGTDHDQLVVVGGVDISDATLSLSGSIGSLLGQVVTLIDNDDTDAVVGTFAGLPEGSNLILNGAIFAISYVGGDGNDVTLTQVDTYTAVGDATDETFSLSANATGFSLSRNGLPVADISSGNVNQFVIDSAGGDDNLTLDFSGGNPIPSGGVTFDGGVGGFDSLSLLGGSASMIEHTFQNESDGTIDVDGSLVTYLGLEPIDDNLDALDRVFTFTGGDETIDLSDFNNGAGQSLIDSTLGESVVFNNPASSLRIDSLSGSDVFNLDSLDSNFDAAIEVRMNTDDIANLNAALNLGSGLATNTGDFLIATGEINVNSGASIATSSGLDANQTGNVDLQAQRNITMHSGSSITTQDGNIDLFAGQAAAGLLNLTGVVLDGASLQSIGNGSIGISGNGDSDGTTSGNHGVAILNASVLQTSGSGTITVSGTSGSGADDNVGVFTAESTQIRTGDGLMSIFGSAFGSGQNNDGVRIEQTVIEDTAGGILIQGTGADGVSNNAGVKILATPGVATTTIHSVQGDVTIEGYGSSFGTENHGIVLDGDVSITVDQISLIELYGEAGATDDFAVSFASGLEQVSAPLGLIDVISNNGKIGAATSSPRLLDADDAGVFGHFTIGEFAGGPDPAIAVVEVAEYLELDTSTTLTMQVNGSSAGIDHDQLIKSGTGLLELGSASLMLEGTIASNPGQSILLIRNDAPDAITGTFASLPEGSTVPINGIDFALSYVGGDGNDVTLTENAVSGSQTFDATDGDDDILLRLAPGSPSDLQVLLNGIVAQTYDLGVVTALIINGLNGNDRLTIDHTNGNPIPSGGVSFDGGNPTSNPGDAIEITGGSALTITHTFLSESDGTIDIDGSVISYSGLEPINDNMNAINRVFNFMGGTETISLSNDADILGQNLIDSTLGESVSFTNPTVSLTINAGDGDDQISVLTLDPGNRSALTIDGGSGSLDSLTLDNVNLDTDGNGRGLTLSELETILVNDGTISNNLASIGGGVLISNSTSGVTTTATFDSVTITGNAASGGFDGNSHGGGIYGQDINLVIEDASNISGNFAAVDGGGIYLDGGSLSITSSAVSSNTAADSGGGAYVNAGALVLDGSVISANIAQAADSGGGGVYLLGTGLNAPAFSINNTDFSSNRSSSGGGGLEIVNNPGTITDGLYELNQVVGGALTAEGGGAIVVLAPNTNASPAVSISGVTLRNNTAPAGGGLAAVNPNLTLDNVLIENNRTTFDGPGGGIAVTGDDAGGTLLVANSTVQTNTAASDGGGIGARDVDVTLVDTTLSSNQAGDPVDLNSVGRGGGIGLIGSLRSPVLTANRVTVDNNVAKSDGGGIGILAAGLDFVNVTVTDNESTLGIGGGLLYDNSDTTPIRSIAFSTFASNNDPSFPSNIAASGASIDMFATLFTDGIGLFDTGFSFNSLGYNTNNSTPPGLTDPTDITSFETDLAPLADNGGSVPTRAIPLVDEVLNRAPSFNEPVDARMVPRVGSRSSLADVGAFEIAEYVLPFASANEGDGSLSIGFGLDRIIAEPYSLNIDFDNVGGLDLTSTATLGQDYSATDTTLNFLAGTDQLQSVTVGILEDQAVEGDEIAYFLVSPASSISSYSYVDSLTIVDNDVAEADLAITKSIVQTRTPDDRTDGDDSDDLINANGPFTPVAGGFVTYQVVVNNSGQATATQVQATDLLPSGLALVPGSFDAGNSGASVSISGQQLTFDLPDMISGQSITFGFEVQIASEQIGPVTNTISVQSSVNESNVQDNVDSVSFNPIQQVDLVLDKNVNTNIVTRAVDQVIYTIDIEHDVDSLSDARSVVVSDLLPSGLLNPVIDAPGSDSAVFDSLSRTITIDYSSIPIGQSQTVTISASVDQNAPANLINTASVSSSVVDIDAANNTDTVSVTVIDPSVATAVLSTGTGDGDVTLEVDATGGLGLIRSFTESFDPIGPTPADSVIFHSYLAARTSGSGPREILSSSSSILGDGTTASSQFTYSGLEVSLIQQVMPSLDAQQQQVGAELAQTYSFFNPLSSTVTLDLVRYLDGDLLFDGTIDDGGGLIRDSNQQLTLFVTDRGSVGATDDTFVGITDSGGSEPASGRFSVDDYQLLESAVLAGDPLDDTVNGDQTGDGFIDSGSEYDVAVAMRRVLTIAPGQSISFTATTLFGGQPAGAALTGHVYCDANGNGSEDGNELAMEQTVFIDTNRNGLLDDGETFTLTDSNGDYRFESLPAGVQRVTLNVPNGCGAIPENFATQPLDFEIGQTVRELIIDDIDGDGHDDLLSVSDRQNQLIVNSVGNASPATMAISVPQRPQAIDVWRPSNQISGPANIAVAAVGGGQITVNGLNRPGRGAVYAIQGDSVTGSYAMGDGPIDVLVDDFDGDQRPDYVAAAFRSNDFHIRLSGNGQAVTRQLAEAEVALRVAAGDFNNDSHLDLALGGYGRSGPGTVQIQFGDGTGQFTPGPMFETTGNLVGLQTVSLSAAGQGNFPGDSLVVLSAQWSSDSSASESHSHVTVYQIPGDTATTVSHTVLPAGAGKMQIGDLNGDGSQDVTVVRASANAVDLLLNDGQGGLSLVKTVNQSISAVDVAYGDLDGNGRPSLIIAEMRSGSSDSSGGTAPPDGLTLFRLGVDQKSVVITADVPAQANFQPSRNFNRLDVNRNERVTAADALMVINALAAQSEPVGQGEATENGTLIVELDSPTDINGDGRTTALDALHIINYLNASDPWTTSNVKSSRVTQSRLSDAVVSSEQTQSEKQRRRRDQVDQLMAEMGGLF